MVYCCCVFLGSAKSYTAVCIYKPNAPDELQVKPKDMLIHVNRDPHGWVKVKNALSGDEGWVPMACLRVVSPDMNMYTVPVVCSDMLYTKRSGAIVCRDARSYRCLARRSAIDSLV